MTIYKKTKNKKLYTKIGFKMFNFFLFTEIENVLVMLMTGFESKKCVLVAFFCQQYCNKHLLSEYIYITLLQSKKANQT